MNALRTEPLGRPADPVLGSVQARRGTFLLLAVACGLILANIYYAQPLVGPISAAVGLPAGATGLVVTLGQLGYSAGLLLVVPLADVLENRRLVTVLIALTAAALVGLATAGSAPHVLAAAGLLGLSAVAVQILIPFAAHLAPEAERGRAVGNVMAGAMLGIMLSRPLASLVTQLSSWRVVYALSAAAMAALALVVARALPRRVPAARLGYGGLLASMGHIFVATPVLRRRAFYQACLFGAFSLFWTVAPLRLTAPDVGLSQGGLAMFGLAGAAGAISAPLAGRLGDRGWSRPATALAMLLTGAAFLMTRVDAWGDAWLGAATPARETALMAAAAFVLDFGVQANVVLGQRAIFALAPEHRGRLNALYMASFFVAGALGSSAGSWAYARGGWAAASWLGLAAALLAFLYWTSEPTRPAPTPQP